MPEDDLFDLRGDVRTERIEAFGHDADSRLTLLLRVLDQARSHLTIADLHAPDQALIYVSRGFETLTGYAYDEVVGRNCRFLQNDDREQRAIRTIAEAIQAGEETTVTLRNYTKAGDLFWNELHLSYVTDRDGRPRYAVGVQNDVTTRVKLETQLQQAVSETVSDAAWFTDAIMSKLSRLNSGTLHDSDALDELTPREKATLEWVSTGLGNAEIALRMGLAERTVRNYVTSIYDKLGVHSRGEAIVWARDRGITAQPD